MASRVLESGVRELLLFAGSFATDRRAPHGPPQLSCTGGDCSSPLSSLRCTRTLGGGWSCTGTPPAGMVLRNVDVSCQGWDSPSDAYIVGGSCAATYELHHGGYHYRTAPSVGPDPGVVLMFVCVAFLVFLFMCVDGVAAPPPPRRRRRRSGSDHYHYYTPPAVVPVAVPTAPLRRASPSPQTVGATTFRRASPSPQTVGATTFRRASPSPQTVAATSSRRDSPSPQTVGATSSRRDSSDSGWGGFGGSAQAVSATTSRR